MSTPVTIPPLLRAHELDQLLATAPRLRLLDVRTTAEFENVHIGGSYNVPLDQLREHGREISSNVTDPVVLVCQSGQRARRAEDALKAGGMANVHVLDGGIAAWLAGGYATVRGAPRLSMERQVRIAAGTVGALGAVLAMTVHDMFALVPLFVGSGLTFAGLTNRCGLALVLTRLPYNRTASCDVAAMVRALQAGTPPVAARTAEPPAATPCAAC